MQMLNGKVTSPLSLLQDTCSFMNLLILVVVALTTWLEIVEKALCEERAARLAVDQSLAEAKAT
jgi:Tfp pilus assembly protein PilX